MRSLRLGESSWLSINNGRRQISPGGGKGRREDAERGQRERERPKREREAASNLGRFTTIAAHGVSGVSGETKRWSTFEQHMSRMCSGHGGTRGRKKNRGVLAR